LLVEVLILAHFAVNDLVQDGLELLLHLAYSGRHQMAEVVVQLRWGIELSRAVDQLDVVLRVGLLEKFGLGDDFIINGIVVLGGLCAQLGGLSELLFPVLLVGTTDWSHKGLAGLELCDGSV